MKIDSSSSNKTNITELPANDKRQTEVGKSGFNEKLKMFENKSNEERIQLLVNEIIQQGEKLGKRMDIKEVQVYKKLISNFMEEAVSNSHKFSKESFLDRRGRHRVYAVIKTVNKELDDLTKDVLSNEKDHIKILKKIDDIKGLIMDLFL